MRRRATHTQQLPHLSCTRRRPRPRSRCPRPQRGTSRRRCRFRLRCPPHLRCPLSCQSSPPPSARRPSAAVAAPPALQAKRARRQPACEEAKRQPAAGLPAMQRPSNCGRRSTRGSSEAQRHAACAPPGFLRTRRLRACTGTAAGFAAFGPVQHCVRIAAAVNTAAGSWLARQHFSTCAHARRTWSRHVTAAAVSAASYKGAPADAANCAAASSVRCYGALTRSAKLLPDLERPRSAASLPDLCRSTTCSTVSVAPRAAPRSIQA